ncbi:MAG: ATP-binding protein [Emcibacteraceae bacterium]|nr:ATP-binding protein [Emcibacteraceae bacterium]
MTTEKHGFEAEVSRLLHMMVHSVYSEREIFLRELISNASDACDKLRYAGLTNNDLLKGTGEFAIDIKLDKENKTLTISDNGVGMDREDLISHLGTIARSGTSSFMEEATAPPNARIK